MGQAMRRADEKMSPRRFEKTREQLMYVIDYFSDVFTFQNEQDEKRVRVPELEEVSSTIVWLLAARSIHRFLSSMREQVLQAVFETEERIRGETLNAQDLRDRFRHPQHGGAADLNLH